MQNARLEVLHGASEHGMDMISRNLDQRNEHEVAERKPRVRNLELRFAQDEIAEKEDVEIDCPRSVLH